jgi:hypothetical protein
MGFLDEKRKADQAQTAPICRLDAAGRRQAIDRRPTDLLIVS